MRPGNRLHEAPVFVAMTNVMPSSIQVEYYCTLEVAFLVMVHHTLNPNAIICLHVRTARMREVSFQWDSAVSRDTQEQQQKG